MVVAETPKSSILLYFEKNNKALKKTSTKLHKTNHKIN